MPYSPGGIFSLVASYFANPGTTIRTEQHNPVFEDVGSALSQVLIRDGRAPMTGPLNMNGFPINNVVAGNSPSSVATLAQGAPIGSVIDFAASVAPAGWMLCYGQAISRATYATLFAIIGTGYGAGDGSTTFNIPDFRGRTAVGSDNMGGVSANRAPGYGITATGGSSVQALSVADLPVLNPTFVGDTTNVVVQSDSANFVFSPPGVGNTGLNNGIFSFTTMPPGGGQAPIVSRGTITPLGYIQQFGGGGSHNNMQPSLALSKIIKVSYDV